MPACSRAPRSLRGRTQSPKIVRARSPGVRHLAIMEFALRTKLILSPRLRLDVGYLSDRCCSKLVR